MLPTVVLPLISFTPPTIGVIFVIILVVFLLMLSAFASGSEVAFFSLNPNMIRSIKEKNDTRSKIILDFLKEPEELLATVLIANNFINIAIVILSGFAIQSVVDFTSTSACLSFFIQVGFLTFILLLFGEILPKVYASNHAQRFIIFVAHPLRWAYLFFKPSVKMLTRSTHIVNRYLINKKERFSKDDLSHALELTQEVEEDDKEILEGILKFGNTTVEAIMCSRLDLVALRSNQLFSEVVLLIRDCGYSRIPVYRDSIDDIKGILYVKDLLPHLHKGDAFKWQTLLRSPFYVPDKMKINELLKDFQRAKTHMAIVVDEYGGTTGIVTMEDILEEIVGAISDDTDEEEQGYEQLSEREFIFDAKTLLKDCEKILKIEENTWDQVKGDADSLGGLMLELKGDFPLQGEDMEYMGYHFEIMEVDDRRVKKVKVVLPALDDEEEKHEA